MNFRAGHAAWVVRNRGNDTLEGAPSVRLNIARPDISPGDALRVGLAGALAILDVVRTDIKKTVVATVSVLVVFSLAHRGCGATGSRGI